MKKKYYIRTYLGGFIQVTKKQFLDYVNQYNIGISVNSSDDYGFVHTDVYTQCGFSVAYVAYEVACDDV